MKKMLIMLFLCSGFILAQGPDAPIDPNSDPSGIPPDLRSFNLANLLASEANYSGYLPSGDVDFEVENLGAHPSTLWLIYQSDNGSKQIRYLTTPVGGLVRISGDSLNRSQVYLISIQPFALTAETPVKTVGPPSRRVNVKQAPRSMELRVMETPGGSLITIGLDTDGTAHFPVHGRALGSVQEDGTVLLDSGGFLIPTN